MKLANSNLDILNSCISYYLEFMVNSATPKEIIFNLNNIYKEWGRIETFLSLSTEKEELELENDSIYFMNLLIEELIDDEHYELDTISSIRIENLKNLHNLLHQSLKSMFQEKYSMNINRINLNIEQSYWCISQYLSKLKYPLEYEVYLDTLTIRTIPFSHKNELKDIIKDFKNIVPYKENINIEKAFENYKKYLSIYFKRYFDVLNHMGLLELGSNFDKYSPKTSKWIEACKEISDKDIFKDDMWKILGKDN